jgi:hypothetical protein
MKKLFVFIISATLLAPHSSKAQQTKHGFEILELVKIAENYRLQPDLSFSFTTTLSDSVHLDSVAQTLNGQYKMHNGLYWLFLDSVEYIQGNQFYITVDHRDSVITVNNKRPYTNILSVPLLDSLFREANIDTMSSAADGSSRLISIKFNSSSPYSKYDLFYDADSLFISTISYYIREYSNDSTEKISSGTAKIITLFSSYSRASVDPSYFDESKFIYRSGDKIYRKPAYEDFKMLVSVEGLTPAK